MSEIVLGVGASHTTLMNTQWAKVDHLARAHAFRDALIDAKAVMTAAAPDLVVIVGSNHFRGFWLDLMPAFTIGVDEVIAAGEHGTPSGPQAVEPSTAQRLCQDLLDNDIDIAFSTKLQVDHGITHAIQYLVPDGPPIVPIVINVFGPPLPSLRRCLYFGDALRRALRALPDDRRVAVIGTGGLSHQIPFPDWRAPHGDDEEFLAQSFRDGRGRWEEFESRRRPIVVGAPPRLNSEFDGMFLAMLGAGTLAEFPARLTDAELVVTGGNGANEVRAWLAMAAALGHAAGRTLAYSPMPEWLTGMAVAVIEPGATSTTKDPTL
jgi:2,3-dihydroxyphenylpropionate 1,2-dioxygenase